MTQCWRFDTPAQTLVLASRDRRLPEVVYWSAPLDPGEDLVTLTEAMRPAPAGGTLDHVQPITVCPLWIDGFTGVQGAEIRGADGLAATLRLRFDVVTGNACRKFHVDAITARLVCTYRGAGTQYGMSTDGTDPSRVFAVATGAPILLRGSLWPEEPASGLLHRSPPIEGTGETRLVLVLDPIFELEEEE